MRFVMTENTATIIYTTIKVYVIYNTQEHDITSEIDYSSFRASKAF
jgi:low affinity Fe/Cu permease